MRNLELPTSVVVDRVPDRRAFRMRPEWESRDPMVTYVARTLALRAALELANRIGRSVAIYSATDELLLDVHPEVL